MIKPAPRTPHTPRNKNTKQLTNKLTALFLIILILQHPFISERPTEHPITKRLRKRRKESCYEAAVKILLYLLKKLLPTPTTEPTINRTQNPIKHKHQKKHIHPSPTQYNIFVRNLQNKTIALTVTPDTPISKLKQEIENREKIASKDQVLSYQNKLLEDEKTLSHYHIDRDSTLHLNLRLRGGTNHRRIKIAHINIRAKKTDLVNNNNPVNKILNKFPDFDVIGITEAGLQPNKPTTNSKIARYHTLFTTTTPPNNDSVLLLIHKDWEITPIITNINRSRSAKIKISHQEELIVHLIYGPPNESEKKKYWKRWKRYLKEHNHEKSILIGDMNETIDTDLDRIRLDNNVTTNTSHLSKLINKLGLTDHYRYTNGDLKQYTFFRHYKKPEETTCQTSCSRIDHTITGQHWTDKSQTKILPQDLNLSPDHSPTITTITLPEEPEKIKDRVDPKEITLKKINTKNLTESEENIEKYQSKLKTAIEKNPLLNDKQQPAKLRYETLINLMEQTATETAGTTTRTINTKETLSNNHKTDRLRKYLKRLSHALQSAAQLKDGENPTKNIKKLEQNPPHYKLPIPTDRNWRQWKTELNEIAKKTKEELEKIEHTLTQKVISKKVQKILESETEDYKSFCRKAKPSSNKGGLNTVKTKEGKRLGDPEKVKQEVLRQWKEEFKAKNLPFDDEAPWWNSPKNQKLFKEIRKTDQTGDTITIDEVEDAIRRFRKKEKSAGVDEAPPELFAYAEHQIIHILTEVFNEFLNGADLPDSWKQTTSSEENPLDYRPISLLCVGYKILTTIIDKRIRKTHEKLFSNEQGGFREGRACAYKTRILTSLYQDAERNNKEIHVCYLDCRKAFDSVPTVAIVNTLYRMGYNSKTIDLIQRLYENNQARIITPHGDTDTFDVESGVKQGCPLSPLLFILFLEPLLNWLTDTNLGYTMSGLDDEGKPVKTNTQAFADDQILVAATGTDLQTLLNMTTEFLNTYGMELSLGKAKTAYTTNSEQPIKLLYNRKRHQLDIETGELKGQEEQIEIPRLEKHEAYRYLGIWISITMNWTKQKEMIKSQIWNFLQHLKCKCFTPQQKIQLIHKILIPAIDYRLQIVFFDEQTLQGWTKWIAYYANKLLKWNRQDGYKVALFPKNKGGQALPNLPEMQIISFTSALIDFGINGIDTQTRRCLQASRNSNNPPTFWKTLEPQLKRYKISIQPPLPQHVPIDSILHFTRNINLPNFLTTTKIKDFVELPSGKYATNFSEFKRKNDIAANVQYKDYNKLIQTITDNNNPHRIDLLNLLAIGRGNLKKESFEDDTTNFKRAFTDGSYHKDGRAGSSFTTSSKSPSQGVEAAIPTPNANSSYAAEIYAIWILLELTETNFNLNIYSDSKSAIDAIKNPHTSSRKERNDPNTPVIKAIKERIKERKSNGGETEIIHCYSHTLDKIDKGNPAAIKKQNDHIDLMKKWFPDRWKEIAQGNQIADELAKEATYQSPINNYTIKQDRTRVTTEEGTFTTGIRGVIKKAVSTKQNATVERKHKEKFGTILKGNNIPALLSCDFRHSKIQTFATQLLWGKLNTPDMINRRLTQIQNNTKLPKEKRIKITNTYSDPKCTFGCDQLDDRRHFLTCPRNPIPTIDKQLHGILTRVCPQTNWNKLPLWTQQMGNKTITKPKWRATKDQLLTGTLPHNLKAYLKVKPENLIDTLQYIHIEYLKAIQDRYLAVCDHRHGKDPVENYERRKTTEKRKVEIQNKTKNNTTNTKTTKKRKPDNNTTGKNTKIRIVTINSRSIKLIERQTPRAPAPARAEPPPIRPTTRRNERTVNIQGRMITLIPRPINRQSQNIPIANNHPQRDQGNSTNQHR